MIYEYYKNEHKYELYFRTETMEDQLKLRVTKNISGRLYHITKGINEDITLVETEQLLKKFSELDDIFWRPLD